MKLPLKLLTLMGLAMIIKGQVALQNLTKEELGSVIDCFPSAVATMAPPVKAENFFVTLYVAFTFGKRWF